MFAAVECKPYRKGIFNLLQREKVRVSYRNPDEAQPFAVLTVKESRKGIKWSEIEKAAGQCREKLVIPENTEIPHGYRLKKFEPKKLPLIMMYNSFESIVKTYNIRTLESISVIDRAATLANVADSLPLYAKNINVFTDNKCSYGDYAKRVMDEYGCSVTIKDYGNPCTDGVVIADRYSLSMLFAKAVFCADRKADGENCLTGKTVKVEDEILSYMPANTDTVLFLSALYELNNMNSLENTVYSELLFGGREVQIEKTVKIINEMSSGCYCKCLTSQ